MPRDPEFYRRRDYNPRAELYRRMAHDDDDADMAEFARVITKTGKNISYPEYKTSDDFSLWLTGFWTRVQNAYGHKVDEIDKIKTDVCRCISSKLSVGGALNAYNRLSNAEKNNYDSLVLRLTEEFTDKHEKRCFIEDMEFNKRKKGQKLKDFMQDIIKDMGRYSGLPDKITVGVGAAAVEAPNEEKERQGVRRFRAGMRNIAGKKDKDLKRHLLFHLMEDKDLNWENAIAIASRWEMSNRDAFNNLSGSDLSESDDSDDDSDNDEEAGAVATKKKSKKKSKKTKKKNDSERISIATLADQVHENQMKIKGIETAQERLTAKVDEVKESSEKSFQGIQALSEKFDNLSLPPANNGSGYFNARRQQQYQQQQQNRQWGQQNNFGSAQRGTGVNTFRGRPQNYTWNARNNQPRQMNFAYQRKTPHTYTTNATQTKPTTTIAAMGESDLLAESLEMEEDSITLPKSEFLNLTSLAGVELAEEEFAAAIDRENFC